ncbi:MAG: peptidoglycan-binding domain-containing protein [Acetivibrionales bacterium]|jgi:hypothetical protein
MATIYVYNNDTGRMETYVRGENEPMPYNTGRSLLVREFRGSSNSNVLWTDKRTMDTWNAFRAIWGRPIPVRYVFKRIWEGGHGYQSQHYAGTAFDVGQALSPSERDALRNAAIRSGLWSYVEPAYLTPTWVHLDKRMGPAACEFGYPLLRQGNVNQYVLVLQDALNAIGFTGSGLDGIFGSGTRTAVIRFQQSQGLSADGIVGCSTWTALTRAARGIGQTPTVVNP